MTIAARALALNGTDTRLTAITIDGNQVLINHINYPTNTALEEWAQANCSGDHAVKNGYVTFSNSSDAWMFWLTFQNRSNDVFIIGNDSQVAETYIKFLGGKTIYIVGKHAVTTMRVSPPKA